MISEKCSLVFGDAIMAIHIILVAGLFISLVEVKKLCL